MRAARLTVVSLLVVVTLLRAGPAAAQPGPTTTPDAPAREPDVFWWTGSLLAGGARTLGAGHTYVAAASFLTRNYGTFDDAWNYTSGPDTQVLANSLVAFAGLTDRLDLGVSVAGYYKHWAGSGSGQFGDLGLKLALQVYAGKDDTPWPDVLCFIKETFPTGRYEDLALTRAGVDAGGGGAFATTVGINLQKLLRPRTRHPVKVRVNFAYQYSGRVQVRGLNTYGGGAGTAGRVEPGSNYLLLAAAEIPLTRRFVLAFDAQWSYSGRDRFAGTLGVNPDGTPATVGSASANAIALAAGLEVNLNAAAGLIIGVVGTPLAQNGRAAIGPAIAFGYGL